MRVARHRVPAWTGPRAAIALVQVLGLAVWFSASAVVPRLRVEWGIGDATVVWLTVSVQLGFVAGAVTSAVFTLPDRVRPHRLLAWSALGAAVCTLVLATVVDSPGPALALRALTGVLLAGVYPVGMKLTTSWSGPGSRFRDLGVLVGALTLGSALPHLLGGLAGPALPWRGVLLGAAAAGLLAALLAATLVRPGPGHAPAPPPHSRYAVRMLRERGPRLVVCGYLGHMWELYAFWTWLPAYLAAAPAATTQPRGLPIELVVFATSGLAGAVGCAVAGRVADRVGPAPVAITALAVSGTCCLLSPVMIGAGTPGLVVFCAVWGASVVADSGVFTGALSDVADRRYVGTALTTQTALGFLLTAVSIQVVPLVAAAGGWPAALLVLLPGPVLGVLAMRSLLPTAPEVPARA
ncbi:MFS transporter [Pseudonocardia halophobica]|uniref:MFS transporter n=1 Tax=Pseudonocardia halophobica TaxID=29401 RepID=A0A9W6L6N5_9PSEU|nr:MFS transporter [Pseudonocardia halophobica]GLL14657.1 MFS transporter [Pseudonocardia halophobica]